ncbi:DUF4232 domain-containing protein [Streptomyces sp. NPDC007148]|uniref:DUF4232 domain-containing protein n=1 Tax=unclassified Streptomyces TaxID=2593676 RepID=UPI00363E5D0E
MRRVPLALAGLLLLTACGTQSATSGSAPGPAHSSCGTEPSSGSGSGTDVDGVRILGAGTGPTVCTEFEVTNHEKVPSTFTITFTLLSASRGALVNSTQTVPSVAPGRTVRRTFDLDGPVSDTDTTRVRILKVRSVPADEAPSTGGPCPASGAHVYADDGDAAMGLRVVGVRLVNCGSRTMRLHGYPQVQLLDEGHRPVTGVKILHGGSAIVTGTGADGPPGTVLLKPGEQAYSVLVWRNTVEAGDPVDAPYVRVRAKTGASPVTVTPELDLGTTGRLGVGPWKKDTERGAVTSPSPSTSP